jgi:phosphopantetheinyl transferase
MKRNSVHDLDALELSIRWAASPVSGISIAAFTDNGCQDEVALGASLSEAEARKAAALADPAERRHYIARRCFQRVFLKSVLNWPGNLAELRIEHRLDTRPQCPDAPSLWLSFSSSGSTAVACASLHHVIGVDVERVRSVENVCALSERFFTPEEAQAIKSRDEKHQSLEFLHYWTAKEAGLKAIGRGIVSGLNSFVVSPQNDRYQIGTNVEFGSTEPWSLQFLDFCPGYIVALVHRIA